MGQSLIQALTPPAKLPVAPAGGTEITRRDFLREFGILDKHSPFCLRLLKPLLPLFPLNLENLFPFFTLSQLCAAGSQDLEDSPAPLLSPVFMWSTVQELHESDETLIPIPLSELIVEGKVPQTCRFQFGVIFVLLAPLYCPVVVLASS